MMIPNELVIITNFVTITNLDMRNTFAGLILPSITSVFYIYLLRENFAQVPSELYYAAKVDGTSDIKYLVKVMVPICKPTIITITILKVSRSRSSRSSSAGTPTYGRDSSLMIRTISLYRTVSRRSARTVSAARISRP